MTSSRLSYSNPEYVFACDISPVATAQSAWERKLRQGFAGKTATWSALGAAQAVSNGGATLKHMAALVPWLEHQ